METKGTELWRRPEDGLPDYEVDVIVVYRTRYKGAWLTITSVEKRHEWSDNEADIFRSRKNEVVAWMPVPALPEDLRHLS